MRVRIDLVRESTVCAAQTDKRVAAVLLGAAQPGGVMSASHLLVQYFEPPHTLLAVNVVPREEHRRVGHRLELECIARGVAEEHGPLLAALPAEAHVWRHLEVHPSCHHTRRERVELRHAVRARARRQRACLGSAHRETE